MSSYSTLGRVGVLTPIFDLRWNISPYFTCSYLSLNPSNRTGGYPLLLANIFCSKALFKRSGWRFFSSCKVMVRSRDSKILPINFCSSIAGICNLESINDCGVIRFWLFEEPDEWFSRYLVKVSLLATWFKKVKSTVSECKGINSAEQTAFLLGFLTYHIRFFRTFSLLTNKHGLVIIFLTLFIEEPKTISDFIDASNAGMLYSANTSLGYFWVSMLSVIGSHTSPNLRCSQAKITSLPPVPA